MASVVSNRAISATSASIASPSSDATASMRRLSSTAESFAARAAAPVNPKHRRTPADEAPSESSTKDPASAVVCKCVPPQNSVDNSFHRGSLGAASSASIVDPTHTTRTGSGYCSPKTARTPLIARAFARSTVAICTGSLREIASFTMFSTRTASAGERAADPE